ncbi:TonB-dependent receptor [Sphingomonas sp.]|uniref:TonB-dependent receptor n=1 Tax=Sphingomonas sp. TaxID=28214 RepID=UPI003B00EFF5
MRQSTVIRASLTPLILAAIVAAIPAHAQEFASTVPTSGTSASDGENQGLTDIVVTAQKRETSLQKTPIAISVLSDKNLADRHVLSLVDLGDGSVPGLRVAPFFARRSALTIGIRGVGTLSDVNQPAREQGVGVYIDGVYLGRAQGLGAALFDVERIEVLKGPQGTLFGRNTEGGAISIVTKRPTGELGMEATAGVSNYGGSEGIAHVNLPRLGTVSFKLDGLFERRGGTVDNPLTGQSNLNSYRRWGVHGSALWAPSPTFSALLQADYSRDESTPFYVQLLAKGSLPLAPIIKVQPDRAKVDNVGVPLEPSVGKTKGASLHLDWKLADWLRARSITSYRKLFQSQFDNGSSVLSVFAPNANFSRYSLAEFRQHQVSQELQLLGDLPQLTFVAGGFYYHEYVRDNAFAPNTLKFNATGTDYTVLPSPVSSTPFPDRASIAKTDSAAIFGQATYTPAFLDDRVHLTLGGRYTHDKKQGSLFQVNGATPTLSGVTAPLPLDASFNRFDPLINLSVNLTPAVHVYGKYSSGYKAGGANSRSLTYRPFGPESVAVYEIGAKTEFLDNRVRLNLAAYTGRYKSVQIDFNAIIPGSNRGTLETTNTDGAGRIKGVEAELTIAPARGLTLTGNYAYNKVRLPAAPNPFVTGNPSIVVYPLYAPLNSASGAVDYSLPVGGAAIVAHVDANYADSQYTSSADPTKSDSSFIVNGRLSLADIRLSGSGATLAVSLWSRNLLNKQYAFLRNFNAALGTYGIFNEPRTYGVEATMRF